MEIKLLSSLNNKEKKYLHTHIIDKKQLLFEEGSPCEEVSVVVEGEVKIISTSKDGKEILFNDIKKGEVFGNNLVFSSNNFYKGDVFAMSNSTLVSIKKNDLILLLRTNEMFLLEYLKIQSDFGKALNARIKVLACDKCKDKIITDLRLSNNEKQVESITSWAVELGESRENLTRCLKQMIENKIISKKSKNHFILN